MLIFIGSPTDLCCGSQITASEKGVVVAAFSQWWDGERPEMLTPVEAKHRMVSAAKTPRLFC